MIDVDSRFHTPEEVLRSKALSTEEKVELLQRWQYEERQIAIAVDEGMPGPDPQLLGRTGEALMAVRKLPT